MRYVHLVKDVHSTYYPLTALDSLPFQRFRSPGTVFLTKERSRSIDGGAANMLEAVREASLFDRRRHGDRAFHTRQASNEDRYTVRLRAG